MIYCNEFDAEAAEWTRNLMKDGLIPTGRIDCRDIRKVTADEIKGYSQVHLFAGVGGWPLAFEMAGISSAESVWSGSCPCQPYSAAGKGKGNKDDRNLWPEMFRLIRECRPDIVFGEQVDKAIGHGWLDGICADLEGEGYAVGSIVLGAHSAAAPQIRQRIYWVADRDSQRQPRRKEQDGGSDECGQQASRRSDTGGRGGPGGVADAGRQGVRGEGSGAIAGPSSGMQETNGKRKRIRPDARSSSPVVDVGMGDSGRSGLARPSRQSRDDGTQFEATERAGRDAGSWSNYEIIPCLDGKSRRIESGSFPLAHGIPRKLESLLPRLGELGFDPKSARRIGKQAKRNRIVQLKGFGNGIVPELAAEFIAAFMEERGIAL